MPPRRRCEGGVRASEEFGSSLAAGRSTAGRVGAVPPLPCASLPVCAPQLSGRCWQDEDCRGGLSCPPVAAARRCIREGWPSDRFSSLRASGAARARCSGSIPFHSRGRECCLLYFVIVGGARCCRPLRGRTLWPCVHVLRPRLSCSTVVSHFCRFQSQLWAAGAEFLILVPTFHLDGLGPLVRDFRSVAGVAG